MSASLPLLPPASMRRCASRWGATSGDVVSQCRPVPPPVRAFVDLLDERFGVATP
ncbi:MAG TPA: hypothetical protein VGU03_10165 [Frateuria sp.]|uniref:hypothetical protein n=1 Tax=Frateuria sp. TaxID=2211372 RepID=UPI002DE5454A|nr:hypothetical protein [Frateuria sp.]